MPPGTLVGAALSVRDARVTYSARGRALTALDGVSFDLQPGEFVSLIGPSGSGKSTLLRAIAGLHRLDSGAIAVDGRPPGSLPAGQVAIIFQEPALLPWRNVAGNVALPLAAPGVSGDVPRAVESVGLSEFATSLPGELSGGMQQRVALARALVAGPRLLLMDEPFGALDEITREEMRDQLLDLWQADRRTVLFVTHSVTEAVLLSDRVLVLSSSPGKVRTTIDINLPRPRRPETVDSPEFQHYVKALRDQLRR